MVTGALPSPTISKFEKCSFSENQYHRGNAPKVNAASVHGGYTIAITTTTPGLKKPIFFMVMSLPFSKNSDKLEQKSGIS